MKIAMIGQKGIPGIYGGIERHVEQLSRDLVKRGNTVTVYTRPYYTPKELHSYHGIRLVSLPTIRSKHFDAITHTFLATLHALWQPYDIVHYHGVGPALLAFIPRLFRPKMKVIVTFHCIDRRHQKWNLFARFVLWLGEHAAVYFPHETIVVSKTLRAYCKKQFGRETTYIPNGIPMEPNPRTSALIRKKFGLVSNNYILAVSRLIPHKGIHYLISAYRQLRTKKQLVIVGDGFYTDSYVQELKKLAGNDPRIVFTGFQSGKTLAELFVHAYLFVLPSETEGLPIALLEAASYGTCILASNIPENMEVIRAGGNLIGYTFQNKNAQDLAKKLRELLRQPRATQTKAKLAKTVVQRYFNWRNIGNDVEQLYSAS